MSVRLSGRLEQLDFHWTDFYEVLYSNVLQKCVEKIQVSLQSDKNVGHFDDKYTFIVISLSILL